MAKITGPLLSMGARGQIGKVMVAGIWKGIPWMRQHVVPANPKSEAQTTQRDIMSDAVDEWHETKYTPVDVAAWNRYAGVAAKVMSGFNAFVKSYVDLVIAGVTKPAPCFGCSIYTGGAGKMDVSADEDVDAAIVFLRWGYSKTNMNNDEELTEAPAGTWTKTGIVVTAGKDVYARFQILINGGWGGWTGIYTFKAV